MEAPGYVVLLDGWSPGWEATIDGVKTRLLRANLAFRAVHVPLGRHTIHMIYRPRAAVIGLLVSAFASIGIVVALAVRFGSKRS
jgi:uncharacterized membrane protein YfhO